MVASWSRVFIALLAGAIAFAASGQPQAPTGEGATEIRRPDRVVNAGDFLEGFGPHFDPPIPELRMYGFALNSGQGDNPIKVALHYEKRDRRYSMARTRPSTTRPLRNYVVDPTVDDTGRISMGKPPVIKANHVRFNLPSKGLKLEDMKRDIRRNCGETLVRRDGPGSCQLPKKVPAATVNPAGRKKK